MNSNNTPSKRSHWGCVVSLLLLATVVGAMVLSCPTRQEHHQAIAGVVEAAATEIIDERMAAGDNALAHELRQMSNLLIASMVSDGIDERLTTDDYWVCSVGKLSLSGRSQPVSVGIMGHVFTASKDDVKLYADNYIKELESKIDQRLKQEVDEKIVAPVKEQLRKGVPKELLDIIDQLSSSPGTEDEAEQ